MYDVIILCAGSGTRTGLDINKLFYKINDKEVILHTIEPFINDEKCENIIVVSKENEMNYLKSLLNNSKIIYTIGGANRSDSVKKGLEKVNSKYVLIHDGARPNVSKDLLNRIKDGLLSHDSIIPVLKVSDTVISTTNEYLNRNNLLLIQTPQAFLTEKIKKAHELSDPSIEYTDDSMVYQKCLNELVNFVDGDKHNIKFTTIDDVLILKAVLK